MAEAGARRPFFRRRKSCPFTGPNAPKIDDKDSKLLMRYVSERGKVQKISKLPSASGRIPSVSTEGRRGLAHRSLALATQGNDPRGTRRHR
jgi:small subunit ribosomal protein S18